MQAFTSNTLTSIATILLTNDSDFVHALVHCLPHTPQECVSEFISFVTSEASEKCQKEKRKTINGEDLLWAMSTLGFNKYVEPLKHYLTKYREANKDALKADAAAKAAASAAAATARANAAAAAAAAAAQGK